MAIKKQTNVEITITVSEELFAKLQQEQKKNNKVFKTVEEMIEETLAMNMGDVVLEPKKTRAKKA